ncbi:ribonuclease H2 subunit C-like [Hydractinia symbiolongicarpus]|uniref:ribonuclease H2 subunit C-like n=1 Tax=Hydractinia symbiolongicarpus TaxID=13093 RepID=UPI0025510E3F|nr:ribonuclease H2 subunit C-like [Hydractinia symbiolongicarpus]
MSIINLKCKKDIKQSNLHLMPCEIDHDDKANVSKYFLESNIAETDQKSATFRGRLLTGKVISLPNGYQGVVVKEKGETFSDYQERTIQVDKSFDKFTYWNLEIPPSRDDAMMKAFHWLDLAHVIHEPITANEGEGSMESTPVER